MPEGNLQIVEVAHRCLNDGDVDGLIALCDAGFELDMSARTLNPATYSGHDGIRQFYAEVSEVWEEFRWDPQRFVEAGDEVIVLLHSHGRGRGSGLEMARDVGMVWTLRDGRALSVRFYADQAKALGSA